MNKYIDIGIIRSGYINQIFSIFNNNDNFSLKEWHSIECFLCGKKKLFNILKSLSPFYILILNTVIMIYKA